VQLPERPGTDLRLVGCFAQLYLTPFLNCPFLNHAERRGEINLRKEKPRLSRAGY
jgi:hypothetical protein